MVRAALIFYSCNLLLSARIARKQSKTLLIFANSIYKKNNEYINIFRSVLDGATGIYSAFKYNI